MEVIATRPKSLTSTPFTYCPGCQHGVAHRLIAEAIDELGLQNTMAGVAPVGCSVLPINSLILTWRKPPTEGLRLLPQE